MSFATALNLLRPTLPCYLALVKYDLLRITTHSFEFHPHQAAPPLALHMARTVFALGASSCIESFVMSRTLAAGPKVFAFDALTCEALENFDLNLATADYLQPFPSVVIELPPDYTRSRAVPFETGTHAPDFVIARHEADAGCVLITMHLTSHQVLTRLLKLDPAWTVEEMWAKGARTWSAKDSLNMTAEEQALGNALTKLALNVCLLATAYGVRCLGPANPSHHERLKRHAKLAQNRGQNQAAKVQIDLRTAPVRYAFAQEVTLYQREPVEVSDRTDGGWTVSPHWRRGHWRSQPCGPGRQERRRVAIPSVLVNSHRFLGTPSDTHATYKLPDR
ncbi:MAG TPA: hypothetical protein VEL76_10035 [Gemmataceae bacterium]|nr:hypothetical protein [Gemmataceae bacterium]